MVLGGVLAAVDRRWIKRPVLAVLLVAAVVGGYIMTTVSPFSFDGGGYYMEGVLLSAGAALALIGYGFVAIWQFARGRLVRPKPPVA